ncbi:hypothetical protein Tco_0670016 [Tanacetum coccineum]
MFPPLTGCDRLVSRAKISTLVFVDPEISTQADKAQSPRVPVPFSEDPYEAIRQSYLVETETPKLPHTVASPTSLPDSTLPTRHAKDSVDSDTFGARYMPSDSTALLSPDHPLTHASHTLVPILCRIARMVMRVPPVMSPGLFASIADVAAMSDSAFRKRFRSSYESLPSSSQPDLPSQKHYRGTSELVEDDDDDEEEDNDEKDKEDEDEEVDKTLDSDSESEDAKDEGPTVEDEDPAAGTGVCAPHTWQRAALVVKTAVGKPIGLGYEALRRQDITLGEGWIPSVFELAYIDVPAYPPPAPPIQTPPSPEWSSGSLPVSLAPSIVLSPISSPMILLTVPSPIALPTTAEAKGYLTESLEHEQKKVVVTFRAIWRPVLALESWTEERRTRLDLAKIIDGMRRGHEPKGDV